MTFSLSSLLGSMSVDQFFNDFYEQKPLIIRDHPPDRFDSLARLKDLDFLVSTVDPKSGTIRLAKGLEMPPRLPITREGWLSTPALHDAYREGYSIIMDGLSARWPPLTTLCAQLEDTFRQRELPLLEAFLPVLFLTPPDAQALPPHYDPNDLFIFQLDGCKRWLLYDFALELPLKRHKLAGKSVIDRAQLQPPTFDVVLEPGNLLYLPRGYVHEAVTHKTHSFHLTLGINQPAAWHHVIAALAEETGPLRHSLPPGVLHSGKLTTLGKEQLLVKLRTLLDDPNLEELLEGVRVQAPDLGRGPRTRGFQGLADSHLISAETNLRIRPGLQGTIHYLGTEVKLDFSHDFLTGPLALAETFEFLLSTSKQSFSPREFPGLTSLESQLTLARRLLRLGFLECCSSLRCEPAEET